MLVKWSLTALLGLSLTFLGCSSSNFAGSAGGTKNAPNTEKNEDGQDDVGQPDGADVGDTDEADPDAGGTNEEEAKADKPKAGDLVNETQAACLLSKGDDFRVLFVLDNSGST